MKFSRPNCGTLVPVAGLLCVGLFASSCSMQDKGPSRVLLNIPSSSSLSQRVGTMSYSWDRACFIMNITAVDIASPADSDCEVHRGIFAGSAAPNSSLTAMVTKGSARKLELFAYFRNSTTETCPQLTNGFGTLDRRKIFPIGQVPSFDVSADEVNLSVDVTLPTDSMALSSRMPASCVVTAPSSPFIGRTVAAAAQSTNAGGYTVRQRVSYKPEETENTSAAGYKIKGALKLTGP